MIFAVIGCGAMGSLFGALLARAGHVVWMVDNHPERAEATGAEGIHVESPGGAFHARVAATCDPAIVPAPDYVFIFVKAYDTAAAAQSAAALAHENTMFVTLQNGLGNVEALVSHFGAHRVIGGTTAHGATEIRPGLVRHAGVGLTVLGAASGAAAPAVQRLADVLRGAGLQVETTDDLASAIWSKVVVNCGINPVGALTRLPNGALPEQPDAAEVMEAAVTEAAAVARAKGVTLAYPDPVAHSREVCRATAENLNSMLQDVLRRRRTEIEALNGAIVRAAGAAGVATPVNAVLAALVRAVERTYQRQAPALPQGGQ